MKLRFLASLSVLLAFGCSQPSAPTPGPVSNASPDVEISIPDAPSESNADTKAATDETLVSLSVPGMHWAVSWTRKVKDTLSSLPGVANVTIDFPNKIAHCKTDPEKFSAEKAMEALAEVRFPATLVEDTNWRCVD